MPPVAELPAPPVPGASTTPTIVPATPKAFVPPTTEIKVSALPKGEAQPAPKPGSPRAKLFADLSKRAGITPAAEPAAAADPKPPVTKVSPDSPPAEPGNPPPAPADLKPGETPPATSATTPTDPKAGKVSPWKLVDEYKGKLAKTEQELATVKSSLVPEAERKALTSRVEAAEKRAAELEAEIKFVDYSKSQEFADKYKKPYEEAWKRALSELGELTVVDPQTDAARPLAPNDLLALVNMPLAEARKVAVNLFGDFANDVMAHRKEVKLLFEAQQNALDEARKTGTEREQKQREASQKTFGEVQAHIKSVWEKANADSLEDPKYGAFFKAVEGDEQGNQRLAKGFELVDRAMSENPFDPAHTPDVRASIIKRKAAIRYRAAAFGRLVLSNNTLKGEIAALQKELAEFKGADPDTTGKAGAVAPAATGSARDRLFSELAKKARPI